jgi:hypothetical protein
MTGNTTNYGFLKSEGPAADMSILRISIKENGLIFDEVVVGSHTEALENVSNDPFDTDKFFSGQEGTPELYLIESNNATNKLAISVLPALTNETVVPIGISHVGIFNTQVTEMVNMPEGVNVYLEDRKLSNYVKLKLGDEISLIKGDFEPSEGRYFLKFGHENEFSTADEAKMLGFSYYANGSITVKLYNAGINSGVAKVLDLNGKLIGSFELKNVNGENFISSVFLAPGIYLVNVTTDKGVFVNKVIVPTLE